MEVHGFLHLGDEAEPVDRLCVDGALTVVDEDAAQQHGKQRKVEVEHRVSLLGIVKAFRVQKNESPDEIIDLNLYY